MASSTEPSEDDVMTVMSLTGLDPVADRATVVAALKRNKQNVETVIGLYFDNPDSFKQTHMAWDDTMFGADKDGTANNTGIAFHIESPSQNDVLRGVSPSPDGYPAGAPSRPPSRSNNRSPLSRTADWATENTSGPNSQAQEDEDMQRALRESAQEAGITMVDQDSGVVQETSTGAYFGPANRNHYENDNWAMVPTAVNQTKLDTAPTPSLRKKSPGAPAFLVNGLSTAGSHHMGGLLTILNQIPLARNSLLQVGVPASTYGHNSDWWKGQEILPPRVLAQLQTGELEWGSPQVPKPNFQDEIHRLMAFLDQTERGYGTVSVLTDLLPWPSQGPEKQFYERLIGVYRNAIDALTQTVSVTKVFGEEWAQETAEVGLLEMQLQKSDFEHITTLYEAIDHIMWSESYSWNSINEETRMAMFSGLGDVMVLKLTGEGPADSIEIPLELYPERWLAGRKDEARRIQQAWCDTKISIHRAAQDGKDILQYRDSSSQQAHDKTELLKGIHDRWSGFRDYLQSLASFQVMEESGFDTDKYPDYHAAPPELQKVGAEDQFEVAEDVLKWTDDTLATLTEKMEEFKLQVDQIKAKQRFLGKLLTDPNKPGRPKPMSCKKFLLRGVATSPDVIYVCQRAEADLIELEDTPKGLDQWWKLAYRPNDDQPVKAEKVEVERVLRDMWQETKNPLLVYATEVALDTPRMALPAELERFVKADNKSFRQELNRETTELKRPGSAEPMSPSKRKHRSDTPDSMDTNRASAGSESGDVFDDRPKGSETGHEMMELSTDPIDVESTMGGMDDSSWNTASVKTTSATLTPATVQADEPESAGTQHRGDDSRTMTPEPDEAKNPEMQERSRPPAFVTLSRSTTGKTDVESMEMEISDQHD